MGSQPSDRARGTARPGEGPGDRAAGDAEALAALTAENRRLKAEVERLREELRQVRRAQHETPPHYL